MSLKIAILTPLYYPSVGGTQISLQLLAQYLAAQGCKTRVFTTQLLTMDELNIKHPKKISRLSAREIKEGVEIFRYPVGGFLSFSLKVLSYACRKLKLPFRQAVHNAYRLRSYQAAQMLKDIKVLSPDVILIRPFSEDMAILSGRAAKATGAKLFMHTTLHLESWELGPVKRWLPYLKRFPGHLSTNTDYERQFLISQGLEASKINVTGVGFDLKESEKEYPDAEVDPSVKNTLTGKKYVLYFGRKQGGKGIDTLVEAMAQVVEKDPEIVLVLAGESTKYSRNVIAPMIADKSFVYGFDNLNEATKRWLFKNAQIFSMVSRVDSFGIVYCEAWLSGLPVIGADFGAMRCVIDHEKDGLLVPYGQAADLAQAILKLLADPARSARMGDTGRNKVIQQFANNAVEQKTFEIIQRREK